MTITLTRKNENLYGYPTWEANAPFRIFAYLSWQQRNDEPFTVKVWLRLNDELELPLLSPCNSPFESESDLQAWLKAHEAELDKRVQVMTDDILGKITTLGSMLADFDDGGLPEDWQTALTILMWMNNLLPDQFITRFDAEGEIAHALGLDEDDEDTIDDIIVGLAEDGQIVTSDERVVITAQGIRDLDAITRKDEDALNDDDDFLNIHQTALWALNDACAKNNFNSLYYPAALEAVRKSVGAELLFGDTTADSVLKRLVELKLVWLDRFDILRITPLGDYAMSLNLGEE